MSCSLFRVVAVAAVVLALVLTFVPTAQASPIEGSSHAVRGGWFDIALSWLGGLFFGVETPSPRPDGFTVDAGSRNPPPAPRRHHPVGWLHGSRRPSVGPVF